MSRRYLDARSSFPQRPPSAQNRISSVVTGAIPRLRAEFRRYSQSVATTQRAEVEHFAETLLQSGEAFSQLLLALLRDSKASTELRLEACMLLRALAERRAIPALIKVAQSRHEEVRLRREAIQALGLLRSKSKRAVLPLIEILSNGDDDEWARRLAAHSLGFLNDPRGRDTLFRLIKDETVPPGIRGDATEALTHFQDVRAVPTLREQLLDASPEVRFWAVFSLGQLADTDVIPELERVVMEDDAVVPGWWSLKKEARDAIQSIRNRVRG
jgi:HEAT repeat protein